jgi:hypothetical protein
VPAQKTSRKRTQSKRTKQTSRRAGSRRTPVVPEAAPTFPTARTSTPVRAAVVSVAPAPRPATIQTPPRASGTKGPGMVVVAVAGVLVVAALALARYPSPRAVSAAVDTPPLALPQPVHVAAAATPDAMAAPAPVPVASAVRAHVPKSVFEKPKQTLVVTATGSPADSAPLPPPAVEAASLAGESASKTVGPERTTSASAAASTTTPDAMSQISVTITGCLETTTDEDRFRLTDTEGADAPKARSWRSGFLKKHSAPVELVELSDRQRLRKYVGRRVVATGLLTSRELRVRSLESAGPSCH